MVVHHSSGERNSIAVWTGALGTLLFTGLLVVASVRLFVHMQKRVGQTPVFRRCHVVIVLQALFDIPRFVAMLVEGVAIEFQPGMLARVVYSFHLISTWLQVVALTMIILMWSTVFTGKNRSLTQPQRRASNRIQFWTKAGFLFMNLVLLAATIVVVVPLVLVDPDDPMNRTLDHEETYFPFVIMSSGCLFMCAAGLLTFGIRMHYKIAEYQWRAASLPVVRKLLRSFTATMGVCTAAFALRIAMLLSLFSKNVRDNAALNELEWQLLSYWIPTIVSAAVLLVFMKAGRKEARPPQKSGPVSYSRNTGGGLDDEPSRYVPSSEGSHLAPSYGHQHTYDSLATSPLRQPSVV